MLRQRKLAIGIAAVVISLCLLGMLWFLPSSRYAGVPVLNYHQINDKDHNMLTISSQEFDEQMAYLHRSGYTTISPEQLLDYLKEGKTLPDNPILITFDDGYEDNYRVAYPILKKYHFTAAFFIITDFVDRYPRYMTWTQLREMQDNGFFIGSHTVSHINLTTASDTETSRQLTQSKATLEQRLGVKIEYLAYPGGSYDQRVIHLVKQAGYRAAFTVNFGRDSAHCEAFTLNRIPIFYKSHTFSHFWLRLKFTQLVNSLQDLKNSLNHWGAKTSADWIRVP